MREKLEGGSHTVDVSDDSDDERRGGRGNGEEGGGAGNDKPSESQLLNLEEKVETAQANQKNLYLIIFQVKYITPSQSHSTITWLWLACKFTGKTI